MTGMKIINYIYYKVYDTFRMCYQNCGTFNSFNKADIKNWRTVQKKHVTPI